MRELEIKQNIRKINRMRNNLGLVKNLPLNDYRWYLELVNFCKYSYPSEPIERSTKIMGYFLSYRNAIKINNSEKESGWRILDATANKDATAKGRTVEDLINQPYQAYDSDTLENLTYIQEEMIEGENLTIEDFEFEFGVRINNMRYIW